MNWHPYADDGTQDMDDHGRCITCGLPESNRRHHPPDLGAEMREQRRRIGERDG